jgi:acyl-CoA thioesterase YciA
MTEARGGTAIHGEPVLRVLPEPADINSNGHIFGGWILAMMDRAGGIVARRVCRGRCATVAIEKMEFIAPIHLGDLISIYGSVERRGRTSIAIRIDVIAERDSAESPVDVTTGLFTFVALDDDFRPRPLPTTEPSH